MSRDNKGRFTEGNKGRPKGAKGKIPSEIRAILENVLYDHSANIHEDLMKLSPKDRVRAYTELLKYVLPAKKNVEVSEPAPEHIQRILDMNESDLKKIYGI